MGELLPTKELVIKDREWEGYSLWKYIKQLYPHYTKLLVIKELRLKRILVNSSTSYFQYKLSLGDTISISVLPEREKVKFENTTKLKRRESESFKRTQILFENEHLIIVYKHPGQLVQPDRSVSSISLSELLDSYSQNDSGYKTRFVHRLDKSVSGLLLGAKSARVHNLLSEALKKRELTKLYLSIVIGNLSFKTKTLSNWIDDKGLKVQVQENYSPGLKYSETEITKLKDLFNLSIAELRLVTGRKNQLRAQLAYIGHPIMGDRKYYSETSKRELKRGNFQLSFNTNRIALVAYKIGFPSYLVRELNLPWCNFTLPREKNIILESLKKTKNVRAHISLLDSYTPTKT